MIPEIKSNIIIMKTEMKHMIRFVRGVYQRKNTNISPFAILRDVIYDPTSAIKALAKLERSIIGKCTYVGTLSAVYDCEIGKFCSIARECYIGGAKHPTGWTTTSPCFHVKNNATGICYAENEFEWIARTKIGNDVWIGERATILAGVIIGDGAVIGGGSVVTKDIGPYEIWAGNPARLIRKRFDDETILKLLEVKWWDLKDELLFEYGKYIPDVNRFIKEIGDRVGRSSTKL